MLNILRIINLGLILIGCVHSSFYTPTGINFLEKGELFVAGQRMLIHSELNLETLDKQISFILQKVNTTRKRLHILLPDDHSSIVKVKEKNIINDLLNNIYIAASRHYNDFLSYMETVELNRNKRGLIDVGGKLFKALFGLSTEDDIKEIHTVLDYVAGGYNETLSQLNLHTIILNHTIDDLVNMSSHIHLIYDQMDTMYDKLGDIINEVREQESISIIHLISSQIINSLQSLELDILKLRAAIFSAYNGNLDPYLVPPTLAMQILHDASLNPHVRLPFKVSKLNLPRFYSIAKIIPYKKSDMILTFSIIIPLLSDTDIYELYGITTLPVPSKEHISVRVETQDKILAVSQDNRKFMMLPSLEHCTSTHNTFLCPPISPVYDAKSEFCFINAFLGKPHLHICQTSIYHGTLSYLQRSGNKWLFSLNPSMNATMLCAGKKPEFIQLSGFGHIILPNRCTLMLGHLVIPAMETIHLGNITLEIIEPIPLTPMFDMEEIVMVKETKVFNHSFVNGQSLAEFKHSLRLVKYQDKQLFIHSSVGHSMSILALMISGILLAFFCYSCYTERMRAKHNATPAVIYHDVGGSARILDHTPTLPRALQTTFVRRHRSDSES